MEMGKGNLTTSKHLDIAANIIIVGIGYFASYSSFIVWPC